MENGPLADFEMCFHNKIKVYNSQSKGTLEIKVPSRTSLDTFETYKFNITANKEPDYPRNLTHIIRHMHDCLKQCLDVERNSQENPSTGYPLILKSRNHVNQNSNTTNIGWGSKDNVLPCKARSLPTFESAIAVQPPSGTRSVNDRCISHNNNIRTRPFSVDSLSGRSMTDSGVVGMVPMDVTCHFIINLGWCVRTFDDRFTILFEDGIKLVIESKNQSLKYCDESNSSMDVSGKVERYIITLIFLLSIDCCANAVIYFI